MHPLPSSRPSRLCLVLRVWPIIFLTFMLNGCGDPVVPEGVEPESPSETQGQQDAATSLAGLQLLVEEQCFNVDHCEVAPELPNAECICTLAGVDTEGGEPPWLPPPIWPTIPDAPGWPGPGDGGTPPGGTEPCDIYGYDPGCWEASLSCETGVTRGENASCTASVDPIGALEHVYTWYFEGEEISVEQSAGGLVTWSGTVVESGTVMADVRISGGHVRLLSYIEVEPRQGPGWEWSSGSGLHFAWDLAFPSGSESIGRICRQGVGCPPSETPNDPPYWVAQPAHPSDGDGFVLAEVTGNGPNRGAWYVASVSMDVRMSAALNPLWLNLAPEDLPASCALGNLTNRWYYNQLPSCGGGGPGWAGQFVDWAEGHEEMHFQKVVDYVGGSQEAHLPRFFETRVKMDSAQLGGDLQSMGAQRADCIQQQAATHEGFPGAPVDVWWWIADDWVPAYAVDGPWWEIDYVDAWCYP